MARWWLQATFRLGRRKHSIYCHSWEALPIFSGPIHFVCLANSSGHPICWLRFLWWLAFYVCRLLSENGRKGWRFNNGMAEIAVRWQVDKKSGLSSGIETGFVKGGVNGLCAIHAGQLIGELKKLICTISYKKSTSKCDSMTRRGQPRRFRRQRIREHAPLMASMLMKMGFLQKWHSWK